MYGTSFLVFERTTGRFLGTTRPTAGDIAVFLPLTQADIDRKAAGADVDGARWSRTVLARNPKLSL